MTARGRRQAFTLIEVIVTTMALGIIASVATLALRRFTPPRATDPATIIDDTLTAVMKTGRPVTLSFTVNGQPAVATVNPDGSIVADSALHVDRLSGRTSHAR